MYTLEGRNLVQILRLSYDPTKVKILECFMYAPFSRDTKSSFIITIRISCEMQFLKQVENNGYVALSKNVIHNET